MFWYIMEVMNLIYSEINLLNWFKTMSVSFIVTCCCSGCMKLPVEVMLVVYRPDITLLDRRLGAAYSRLMFHAHLCTLWPMRALKRPYKSYIPISLYLFGCSRSVPKTSKRKTATLEYDAAEKRTSLCLWERSGSSKAQCTVGPVMTYTTSSHRHVYINMTFTYLYVWVSQLYTTNIVGEWNLETLHWYGWGFPVNNYF